MSIPLVQEATKDAINTSIIAIKRNIERINMLLGLMDSGSSDLSGLATKQELQDAVNSLQPVDEVTLDNMQSVTSNAVAKLSERVDTSNWTITYETSNVTNCTVTCTRIGKGIAIVEIVIFSSGSNNSRVISLVTVDTHGKVGNIISHLGYTVCCGDQFEIVPKWCQAGSENGVMSAFIVWSIGATSGSGIGRVAILVEYND